MIDNALEAVAQAAVQIAAERDRLNRAFDSLLLTVSTLSDGKMGLRPDGTLWTVGEPAPVLAPEPEPAPTPPAPTPPAPTPPAKVATARGISPEVGLARSPRPRSEMKSQQREAEERMDRIVQYILSQPDHKANPIDTWQALESEGLTKERTSSDFRTLESRGVLRRTGKLLHSQIAMRLPPVKRGRQTVEYVFVNGRAEGEQASPPPKPHDPVTQEQARNAIIQLEEFNLQELMRRVEADDEDRRNIVRWLDDWVNKGTLHRTMHGWKYIKPTEPGAAAAHEHQARGSGVRRDVSGPIAGTGKQPKSSHPEVTAMLGAARRQWGVDSVEQSGDNHWKIRLPKGNPLNLPFVRIANTPGSAKSLNGDKVKLRKAGLRGV